MTAIAIDAAGRRLYATWSELSLRHMRQAASFADPLYPYMVELESIGDSEITVVEIVYARNELDAAFSAHTMRNTPNMWQVINIERVCEDSRCGGECGCG